MWVKILNWIYNVRYDEKIITKPMIEKSFLINVISNNVEDSRI